MKDGLSDAELGRVGILVIEFKINVMIRNSRSLSMLMSDGLS